MAAIESNILLDRLSTEIQEIIDETNLRFKDLRINQLVWKPGDNIWGINEVLEHVNLFGRYYLVEIQNKMDHRPQIIETYECEKPKQRFRRRIPYKVVVEKGQLLLRIKKGEVLEDQRIC